MATAPQEQDEPLPGEEPELNSEPVLEQDDYDPENDPYAPLATRIGWVPKDQFKGDVSKWKPAEEYILAGHDIQRNTAKELREMRSTLDTMSRTTASIMEDKLAEQRAQLIEAHQVAVEDGDPEKAFAVSQQIARLSQAPAPSGNDPVAKWQADNPWYKQDPLATDLAFQTCNRLAQQGFGVQQQLDAARKAVEREFPELVGGTAPQPQARNTPPSVRGPTSRTVAPSNRAKGFHDLPKPAQDVAKDMVERGKLNSVDEYATKYWQNYGRKA